MATRTSKAVVYSAIAANLIVAMGKFAVAAATGSSAMLSEGVHSLVDTGNGMLLLYGIERSQQPPDAAHPFGHGKELYFWTLVVAMLVIALGGGISIFGGIQGLLHPQGITQPKWNYAVLSLAAVLEGATWLIAVRQFRGLKGSMTFWHAMKASKDPTTFAVLVEDTAALLGLMVAFLGIYLADVLAMPRLDAVAAILIGLLLATVGFFLAYKCRGLLVGEGVDDETLQSIRALVEEHPAVARLVRALTMHFGPSDVLLTMEIQFKPDLAAEAVAAAIERLDRSIKANHPDVRTIFLESQSIAVLARSNADSRSL